MGYGGSPSFEDALREVSVEKRKSSHWIWYVVPHDQPSKTHGDAFALRTPHEVASFLENDYLRGNYTTIMGSIAHTLEELDVADFERFAPAVDLNKMYLSARMFATHAETTPHEDVKTVCRRVMAALEPYVQGKKDHDERVGRQTVLLRSIFADIRAKLHNRTDVPRGNTTTIG